MENIKYNQNNEILKNISHKYTKNYNNYLLFDQRTNLWSICIQSFSFFLPIYSSIIELLSPAATKISRRRRLHRLQSTHTRPLSRRNTAGRIIMYSISLRGLPLALLPPSDLLSFSRTPLALSHGGRGAGKKHGECRDEGSPRRFPRRKTTERGTRGGRGSRSPLSSAIPGYTRCWTLHHPHFWSYGLRNEGAKGGKRGCMLSLQRDVHRQANFAGYERGRSRGGGRGQEIPMK